MAQENIVVMAMLDPDVHLTDKQKHSHYVYKAFY